MLTEVQLIQQGAGVQRTPQIHLHTFGASQTLVYPQGGQKLQEYPDSTDMRCAGQHVLKVAQSWFRRE